VAIVATALKAVEPSIEILDIVPNVAVRKPDRMDGCLSFEALHRPPTMMGGLSFRKHPFGHDVYEERRRSHVATDLVIVPLEVALLKAAGDSPPLVKIMALFVQCEQQE